VQEKRSSSFLYPKMGLWWFSHKHMIGREWTLSFREHDLNFESEALLFFWFLLLRDGLRFFGNIIYNLVSHNKIAYHGSCACLRGYPFLWDTAHLYVIIWQFFNELGCLFGSVPALASFESCLATLLSKPN
jgi:hypothetical protein